MFTIDLTVFLSCLVLLGVGVMFWRFFSEKYHKIKWLRDQKYLIKCSLCAQQFFIYRTEGVGVCPRCKNLISLNGKVHERYDDSSKQ